jgi:hypothetical protein
MPVVVRQRVLEDREEPVDGPLRVVGGNALLDCPRVGGLEDVLGARPVTRPPLEERQELPVVLDQRRLDVAGEGAQGIPFGLHRFQCKAARRPPSPATEADIMKAHDRTTRPARIPLAIALTLQLLYVSGVTRPKRAIDFAAAMRPADVVPSPLAGVSASSEYVAVVG